ncbi:MAG: hypothetical protein GQ540_03185 [Lutibacter sp.]|uniref:hypothetical protein n=1 Tax=Lutibacter sp. TaxID=1925666 RepID=UPI001A020CE2|nr:hypothetical protein [Lutibacter sp.]NOR27515.1 hypothetical protein [Lutibacter sp.]
MMIKKCNVCDENEESTIDKIYGVWFADDNELQESKNTNIHICETCIKSIKEFKLPGENGVIK